MDTITYAKLNLPDENSNCIICKYGHTCQLISTHRKTCMADVPVDKTALGTSFDHIQRIQQKGERNE